MSDIYTKTGKHIAATKCPFEKRAVFRHHKKQETTSQPKTPVWKTGAFQTSPKHENKSLQKSARLKNGSFPDINKNRKTYRSQKAPDWQTGAFQGTTQLARRTCDRAENGRRTNRATSLTVAWSTRPHRLLPLFEEFDTPWSIRKVKKVWSKKYKLIFR